MKIGCHISIRRGYLQAAKTAVALEAQSYQYFPKNPRSLALKSWDRKDAAACAAFCREYGLVSIAHTPYPVNLAVPPGELRDLTVRSLINDLEIAEDCGSLGIIVHFGKGKQINALQDYQNILQCINEVLARWEGNTLFLLENLAGEGGNMGTTLEELCQIRRLSDYPDKIGFCLDTCHLFASGVWRPGHMGDWTAKGEALGYFDGLKAIHLNDSRYPSGSGKDRHAPIGGGHIGAEEFRRFFSYFGRMDLPGVLETESGADGTHRQELALVKQLMMEGDSP